jgi:hypothetical protein
MEHMQKSKYATRATEKTVTELSGANRELAQQGGDVGRDAIDRTRVTVEETTKATGEVYSVFSGGAVDFHRQWLEMVRENANATLDFAHQMLEVKSSSALVELSAGHGRRRLEALTEQARHFTGMAQKMTADLAVAMQASVRNVINKAA